MPASYVRTSVPGVYKRGSRYVVTFTDPAGVRRKRSAATLAEARLLKSSLTADVARGEYREQSRVRFDEYALEWVRTFLARRALTSLHDGMDCHDPTTVARSVWRVRQTDRLVSAPGLTSSPLRPTADTGSPMPPSPLNTIHVPLLAWGSLRRPTNWA